MLTHCTSEILDAFGTRVTGRCVCLSDVVRHLRDDGYVVRSCRTLGPPVCSVSRFMAELRSNPLPTTYRVVLRVKGHVILLGPDGTPVTGMAPEFRPRLITHALLVKPR